MIVVKLLNYKNVSCRSRRRAGRGIVEVIAVAGIVGFFAALAMMALPRGRETSRMVSCQRSLMQVGVGLQLYHQGARHYPTVPPLGAKGGEGPIRALLESLAIPDLLDLSDPSKPPKPGQAPPGGLRVPGLVCPSDPNAMGRPALPLVSYRANTGDDPTGQGGPFQPGRAMTSEQIEAADGLAYTAAFAERLVGDGRDGNPDPANYGLTPGPVDFGGCVETPAEKWRGDAGSDWAEASWRSTLYSHAPPPNAARSCIADDGRTAWMGASSGHVKRINILMMDGSVRGITPTIDPKVWAGLGSVGTPAPNPLP
jgi:prepilin-type processing-associated H-X9-DG protein